LNIEILLAKEYCSCAIQPLIELEDRIFHLNRPMTLLEIDCSCSKICTIPDKCTERNHEIIVRESCNRTPCFKITLDDATIEQARKSCRFTTLEQHQEAEQILHSATPLQLGHGHEDKRVEFY
jgi:hypothetical protein